MNTDPADTHSPHLELDELLAEVDGQAIGNHAREHLATCEHCRAEANRWNLIAGGVRSLAAAAPESAPPARRRLAPQVLADTRRRTTLAASAAAAILLLGGASYGVSAALTGHAPATARSGTKAAALTAVSGCASLGQADGTLEQVNGTSLVIKTASGQRVTVTTTASTFVSISDAPLGDITDGASVIASGHSSDGTIEAGKVALLGGPAGHARHVHLVAPGMAVVQGTVSDSGSTGFTVVTSAGTRVPVITSSATKVVILDASLSQLQIGARTTAVGHAGPDGTLSAISVVQPLRAGARLEVRVPGCSPASIDDAITTALVSGS